jgi:acetyl esterase/lipase
MARGSRVSIARVASDPPYLSPFVLPFDEPLRDRREHFDLYLPAGEAADRPAIVFLHGLYPASWRPTAREWPTYVGYGATAAASGAVGVVADVALHGPADYPRAADVVSGIIDEVRRDARVDSDRVAVWAFSGGGLLTGPWLSGSHPWLRCVALSYPVLAPLDGWSVDPAFCPTETLNAGAPPIVLTRVGRERPEIAATLPRFLERAERLGVPLEILDVAEGQHAFDSLDHTPASREAVRSAFRLVAERLAG